MDSRAKHQLFLIEYAYLAYKKIQKIAYNSRWMLGLTSFWAALVCLSVFEHQHAGQISKFTAQIEFIFHTFLLIPTFAIYKRSQEADKSTFIWFVILNTGLLLNDLTFYMLVYFKSTLITNTPFTIFMLDFAPSMTWILAGLVFLSRLLTRGVLAVKNFIKILLFFMVFSLMIVYVFLSSIHYAFSLSSWQTTSQILLVCMQFLIFDCAILCLIYSENKGLSYFLGGLTTLIAGNLFIVYSVASQTSNLMVYGELLWCAGLMYMMFGGWMINKSKNDVIKNWFRESNAIKSRLVLWSFGISILSFLLFFIIAYSFTIINKEVLLCLPFFIMVYSVIVVAFAILMGKRFEIPFKKIEHNIKLLMLNDSKAVLNDNFSIREFSQLQNFIIESYEIKEERDRTKKELGQIAAQVAHDIRSPLVAIQTFTRASEHKLEEKDRLFLRNAFNRIDEITQNLIARYKGNSFKSSETNLLCIGIAIAEILDEKRIEYKDRKIIFIESIASDAYTGHVTASKTECRRMLSNLINNAVNAMPQGGVVRLTLHNAILNWQIIIEDQGTGISESRINDLLSSAPSRIGLGLTHAKSYLAKTNGKLTISSIETKGTIITIDLPKATIPTWLCTELVLNQNARIAVIDDDQTIHDTWNRKLSDATYPLFHFQSSELFLAWYQNNPAIPLIILCDYEFINSTQNGLDVFEKINTQQKILVTSHYDEKSIIERCMQLNIKLLPKHFVPFIKIKKIDSTPPSLIFIDNEPYNINIWRHFAELKDIKIKTYLSSEDFWKDKDQFSHDIPIYIDCDLGQNKPKGVEVAKTLQAEGFKNLYLATGYTGGEIDSLPSWLTLVSKEPPFM